MASKDQEFDMETYLREVASSFDAPLVDGLHDLRTELNKIATAKGLGDINQTKLDQALEKLRQKAKANFERNMTKFLLYAVRNVFTAPSSSAASDASGTNPATLKDAELVELEEKVATMKEQYQQSQSEYLQIANKCRDMDHLIKEMRNALFTLRVASQSFEEIGTHNLDDATVAVQQYKRKLQLCTEQASAYLSKMDGESKDDAAVSLASSEEDHRPSEAVIIQSGSAGSIQKIAHSMAGK